jgi:hypothetical protein
MENIKKWGKELGFLALTVGEFRCLMRNPYFSKMFVSLYREREREREREKELVKLFLHFTCIPFREERYWRGLLSQVLRVKQGRHESFGNVIK